MEGPASFRLNKPRPYRVLSFINHANPLREGLQYLSLPSCVCVLLCLYVYDGRFDYGPANNSGAHHFRGYLKATARNEKASEPNGPRLEVFNPF